MKVVITSGSTFVDIDALACAVAYRDFVIAKNNDCEVVFPGVINETVPNSIKSWRLDIKRVPSFSSSDTKYIIVDCSNPDVIPSFVDREHIIEIYDHRYGYENYWVNLNAKIVIELVGSCATLIWEEIKRQNLELKVSNTSLKLLYTAIFANTLNFNADITNVRDKKAYTEIGQLAKISTDWVKNYYTEIEFGMLENPIGAIKNDTKKVEFPKLGLKLVIGQIELWDSKNFLEKNKDLIVKVLSDFGYEYWLLTSPSICEGINYLYTESAKVKKLLEQSIGAKFNGHWGKTKRLWLRKEILKKILSI